jgi:Fe2+ or Zn2+ uptake regulation protein
VLQVIRDADGHLTASQVFAASKEKLPSISFATVYNSLRYLKDAGTLSRNNLVTARAVSTASRIATTTHSAPGAESS